MAGDRIIAYIQRGKMFMVHTSRFTKTFKVQGHKQWRVLQGGYYNFIQNDATKVQNYYKCLNTLQE